MILSAFLAGSGEWNVVVVGPVVPANQRREADDKAEDPGPQYQQLGPLGGHDVGVRDGVGDCDVPVEADHHQVQDGGGAHPHVHSKPNGAPYLGSKCSKIRSLHLLK